MKENGSGVRFGAICLGIAVCVVGARCARAQNALGGGQALDRNLRVGSGGLNTPVRDLNALIRYNNAIITGNATGGRSFRGDAGYLAPQDFRSALGSDALFNFRRDSISSAAPIAGIRGTDALQYQFGLSTGQVMPTALANIPDLSGGLSRGANPIHPPGVISSVQTSVTGNTASSALRSTADYNAQQALRPSILGYSVATDGRTSMLTASPLLGVTAMTVGKGAGQTDAAGPEGGWGTIPAYSGLETVPSYVTNPLGLAQTVTTRVETRVETPRAIVEQLTRQLGAPSEAGAKPAPGEGAVPGAQGDQQQAPGTPPKPDWQKELDRIRDSLQHQDETTPVPTVAPAKPGTSDKPDAEPKAGTLEALIGAETGKIDSNLLKALQSTRPVLTTLAPQDVKTPDTYAAHMDKGQALLTNGGYFDAEDAFVRALASKPGDPLANVGRVHAELGAGLFLSAAANLRMFFSEHPEMIGTRYAPSLLPSSARCRSLMSQLRQSIKDPVSATATESGMLLAYLAYQRGESAAITEGLDAMAKGVRSDDKADLLLLGLFQRIWVEGRDQPEATPAPAPAPPPDQKK